MEKIDTPRIKKAGQRTPPLPTRTRSASVAMSISSVRLAKRLNDFSASTKQPASCPTSRHACRALCDIGLRGYWAALEIRVGIGVLSAFSDGEFWSWSRMCYEWIPSKSGILPDFTAAPMYCEKKKKPRPRLRGPVQRYLHLVARYDDYQTSAFTSFSQK